jgi:outer membrane protein assembly factor BamB
MKVTPENMVRALAGRSRSGSTIEEVDSMRNHVSGKPRMSRFVLSGMACLFAWSAATAALGQEIFNNTELRALGLEEAWSTQMPLDHRSKGIAHLAQHVSAAEGQVIFDVSAGGQHWTFSERDLDIFRKPLGVEGARRAAEARKEELKREPLFVGLEATITEQVVPDITVITASNTGVLQSLDGLTGKHYWTTSVGHSIHPTSGVCANDKYVGAINGSRMYILNRKDGQLVFEQSLIHTPLGAPAMTPNAMYVPMVSSLMANFRLEDDEEENGRRRGYPTTYKAHGGNTLPPVVFRDSVAWVTDLGALYVANSYDRGVRFRVDAHKSTNVQPVFVPPNIVIFASVDGYLYFVDEGSGSVIRRFSTGKPIVGSLFAYGGNVYCLTQNGGMFCVDVDTGREMWYASGIIEIKGGAEGKIYCVDHLQRFTALDAGTGRRIAALKSQTLPKIHLNTATDRLFVTTRTGMIQCVQPIGKHFPVAFELLDRKPTAKKQKVGGKAATEDVDPFAEDSDDEKPKKEEEKSDEAGDADPFG